MNVTNIIKKIFLVILFATVAVDTTAAMQEPAEAVPVTQAAESQETHTCKWMITEEKSCDQTFDTKQEFYDHVEEHRQKTKKDRDSKFHCEWKACSYSTDRKNGLQQHIRKHTQDKPFACDYLECTYRAAHMGDLSKHLKTHTSEKLFACDQCTKSFSRKDGLKIHMRKHTGERPFACDHPGCTKSFAQKISLTQHISSHTGKKPYKCTEPGCSYSAAQQSHLDTHIKAKHTEDKPFKCPEPRCGFSTAYKSALTKHTKRKHPDSKIIPPNLDTNQIQAEETSLNPDEMINVELADGSSTITRHDAQTSPTLIHLIESAHETTATLPLTNITTWQFNLFVECLIISQQAPDRLAQYMAWSIHNALEALGSIEVFEYLRHDLFLYVATQNLNSVHLTEIAQHPELLIYFNEQTRACVHALLQHVSSRTISTTEQDTALLPESDAPFALSDLNLFRDPLFLQSPSVAHQPAPAQDELPFERGLELPFASLPDTPDQIQNPLRLNDAEQHICDNCGILFSTEEELSLHEIEAHTFSYFLPGEEGS